MARKRAPQEPRLTLAWWWALGLGVGLLVLAFWLWMQQDPSALRVQAWADDLRAQEPLLERLRAGEAPDTHMVAQASATALAPLVLALSDAHRQRQQALQAYQAQIESVALGNWLAPTHLVSAEGRQQIRLRLKQLTLALDALIRQDESVQTRLDVAVSRWLDSGPSSWGGAHWRRDVLSASAGPAHVMSQFFRVERDIVDRVEGLLRQLEQAGDAVTLENAPAPELVFANEQELNLYRSALTELSELGRREQDLLVQAQRVGGQHARRVGDLLQASLQTAY